MQIYLEVVVKLCFCIHCLVLLKFFFFFTTLAVLSVNDVNLSYNQMFFLLVACTVHIHYSTNKSQSPNIVDLESEEYFSIWNLGHPNYLPPLFSSTACQGGVFIENMFSKNVNPILACLYYLLWREFSYCFGHRLRIYYFTWLTLVVLVLVV